MIVVDTNVICYLFLASAHTAIAEGVFQKDPVWAAPYLWRSEFRNVLAGYLRRETLTVADSGAIMSGAEWLLSGNEFTVTSERVLQLVSTSACSAYDCEFVALAEDLGVKLITADRLLLEGFPTVAMSPEDFVGIN